MWNGTMFVDLDWPLNASSLLSASAELLVCVVLRCTPRYLTRIPSLLEPRKVRLGTVQCRGKWLKCRRRRERDAEDVKEGSGNVEGISQPRPTIAAPTGSGANEFDTLSDSVMSESLTPRADSGVVRIDPLRFLAGCRTRRLNQV